MNYVRELKNISNKEIPIQTSLNEILYLPAGQTIRETAVFNLDLLRGLVEVKRNLNEVNPINEGKQYLRG